MKRSIDRFAVTALALIAVCLMGSVAQCPWKTMWIRVPDFEANQILGLQLWRADQEASEQLTEAGSILFGERYLRAGSEILEYTMLDSQDQPVDVVWPVVMSCEEGGSDACTLQLVFADWTEAPGWIRVTTFNAVDESEPSEKAVFL